MSEARTEKISSATRAQVRGYALEVTSGPDAGLTLDLDGGPITIGTAPGCDLVLGDSTVSGRHCELAREGEALVLRDLGSTNGLYVEEVRVREALLAPGARIRLGRTQLGLKASAVTEVALSAQDHFGALFGRSQAMRAVFAQLAQCAKSDAPLLIEGETGAGKDLAAESVHQASPRADGPCVVFDCSAVTATLLEAELFGYEKGAFTGAATAREGLAEAAHGGTLIIDELGELPLELQPKLLRFLERREVRRLGATAPTKVDVRIVACTNRSLKAEVKAGRFREDLYFRISTLRVRMPALRERIEDLPGLVDRLLTQHGAARRFADLPEADQALLRDHRWPGNVRELRNVVERLLAFPTLPAQGLIESEVPTPPGAPTELLPWAQARELAQEAFERRYLTQLMQRSNGSISEAGRQAGISRQFIQRLMRKHGLR